MKQDREELLRGYSCLLVELERLRNLHRKDVELMAMNEAIRTLTVKTVEILVK